MNQGRRGKHLLRWSPQEATGTQGGANPEPPGPHEAQSVRERGLSHVISIQTEINGLKGENGVRRKYKVYNRQIPYSLGPGKAGWSYWPWRLSAGDAGSGRAARCKQQHGDWAWGRGQGWVGCPEKREQGSGESWRVSGCRASACSHSVCLPAASWL